MTQELIERVGLKFMAALHEHVPEVDRPSARCDFSDEQWLRIEHAARAAIEACDQSQSARIAELEGALAPFAGHANIVDADGLADMDEPDFSGWSLLAGDFRRALSSLNKDSTSV